MDTERTACIHCDLPITVAPLQPGERASCPRCGHVLSAQTSEGLSRAMAFALAALVLLVMSNAFPFMALQSSGLETVMTLPRTAVALYQDGYGELAVVVLAFIVVIPAFVLITILALAAPLTRGSGAPWLVPAGRLLFRMNPWSMVEVFIIGVIVSLVKIGHMATVILGISFWSYVAFALCFTFAISSLDRFELWQAIEESSS